MKKSFALMLVMLSLLNGCGDSKELTDKELLAFLNSCYNTEFTYVGEEESDGGAYSKVKTIYTFESTDGITFKAAKIWQPMFWGGYYYYQDDYLMQWLLAKPELYQKLEDSAFACEVFNEVDQEEGSGGFTLYPTNFSEIRQAAELSRAVIENEAAILPGWKNRGETEARHICPTVFIAGTNGGFSFYCADTDKNEMDFEQTLKNMERVYVNQVRSGEINEELPYEVYEQYPPMEFNTVLYDGEKLSMYFFSMQEDGELRYYTSDQYYTDPESAKRHFPILTQIAACAGFEQSDSFAWSNGTDTIRYDFTGNVQEEPCIYKNGEKVMLQGKCSIEGDIHNRFYNIVLSVEDIHTLFGLDAVFDMADASVTFISEEV